MPILLKYILVAFALYLINCFLQ